MAQEREIKTMPFAEAVFKKRGMYLSADDQEAIHLGLREIYVNSLDALSESSWKASTIRVNINTNTRTIEVIDCGPGIPNKFREDGVYSLVAAATMAHTGSHTDNREVNSIGTNGIGLSAVTHTASSCTIHSDDGKILAVASFEGTDKGAVLKSYTEQPSTGHSGVKVSYVPNIESYHDAWIDEQFLIDEVNEMMKFYPKHTFIINYDGHLTTIAYPNGLKEKDTCIYYESPNLIIALNTKGNGIKPYGNRLYLPNGGNFFVQVKTQMTKTVNDLSGLKLKGEQVQSVFGGYVAIFVQNPLFSNQSKTAISNKEINPEITTAIKSELEAFSKTSEWEKIIKSLEAEVKAEEAAARAREKILKAKKDFSDKKINTMSEKFIDTDWKNRKECDLYLVEGEI